MRQQAPPPVSAVLLFARDQDQGSCRNTGEAWQVLSPLLLFGMRTGDDGRANLESIWNYCRALGVRGRAGGLVVLL